MTASWRTRSAINPTYFQILWTPPHSAKMVTYIPNHHIRRKNARFAGYRRKIGIRREKSRLSRLIMDA